MVFPLYVPMLPWSFGEIAYLQPLLNAISEGKSLEMYNPNSNKWEEVKGHGCLYSGMGYRIKKVPTVVWGVWIDKTPNTGRYLQVCGSEERAKSLAENQWKRRNPIVVKLEEPEA